jgi:hypothetical protein
MARRSPVARSMASRRPLIRTGRVQPPLRAASRAYSASSAQDRVSTGRPVVPPRPRPATAAGGTEPTAAGVMQRHSRHRATRPHRWRRAVTRRIPVLARENRGLTSWATPSLTDGEERAEDQAARKRLRPREFSCMGRVAIGVSESGKAVMGRYPGGAPTSAMKPNSLSPWTWARPPPSAAPLRLLYTEGAARTGIAQMR